ncbi:MAG: CRISPR-associated endonuclease Cas2 [Bacteroidetes bacterium]|nr:CRISPR-associated endonuclease Cas2 [Bacteroidota bacterium]MBU1678383.1 CRISPR-associated endonuclease Cas2 [Bacteroidota bacterium]MBU2505260.1 CRISPR-associated endonuclease Cas2 [Bacteroidota bacterium]
MMVVIGYDVSTKTASGKKRLKKVAETCLNYGIRAQNSVFECVVNPAEWELLKNELFSIYDSDEDSLRFYLLGANWQRRLERYGKEKNLNIDDLLIL